MKAICRKYNDHNDFKIDLAKGDFLDENGNGLTAITGNYIESSNIDQCDWYISFNSQVKKIYTAHQLFYWSNMSEFYVFSWKAFTNFIKLNWHVKYDQLHIKGLALSDTQTLELSNYPGPINEQHIKNDWNHPINVNTIDFTTKNSVLELFSPKKSVDHPNGMPYNNLNNLDIISLLRTDTLDDPLLNEAQDLVNHLSISFRFSIAYKSPDHRGVRQLNAQKRLSHSKLIRSFSDCILRHKENIPSYFPKNAETFNMLTDYDRCYNNDVFDENLYRQEYDQLVNNYPYSHLWFNPASSAWDVNESRHPTLLHWHTIFNKLFKFIAKKKYSLSKYWYHNTINNKDYYMFDSYLTIMTYITSHETYITNDPNKHYALTGFHCFNEIVPIYFGYDVKTYAGNNNLGKFAPYIACPQDTENYNFISNIKIIPVVSSQQKSITLHTHDFMQDANFNSWNTNTYSIVNSPLINLENVDSFVYTGQPTWTGQYSYIPVCLREWQGIISSSVLKNTSQVQLTTIPYIEIRKLENVLDISQSDLDKLKYLFIQYTINGGKVIQHLTTTQTSIAEQATDLVFMYAFNDYLPKTMQFAYLNTADNASIILTAYKEPILHVLYSYAEKTIDIDWHTDILNKLPITSVSGKGMHGTSWTVIPYPAGLFNSHITDFTSLQITYTEPILDSTLGIGGKTQVVSYDWTPITQHSLVFYTFNDTRIHKE